MLAVKLTVTGAFMASSTAAIACPCPDKAIPLEVLAPQAVDVAMVEAEIYSEPEVQAPYKTAPDITAPDITEAVQDPVLQESPEPVLAPPVQTVQAAQTEPEAKSDMQTQENFTAMSIDKKYEAVLKNRISAGADGLMLFDYAGAKSGGDLATIKDYVSALESRDPDSMSDAEATAYWANLYNAVTLRVVLENYPVKSIKKIGGGLFGGGPWKTDEVTVNGRALSLDNIEHDILRKQFSSPYIHYMVNCASIGCPNLQPKLWTAANMEKDRKAAAEAFINSSRGVKINGDKLKVSSIYKWFKEDFGGNDAGVIQHLKLHAKGDLKTALDTGAKISGDDYNWNLNE